MVKHIFIFSPAIKYPCRKKTTKKGASRLPDSYDLIYNRLRISMKRVNSSLTPSTSSASGGGRLPPLPKGRGGIPYVPISHEER